MEKSQMEELPQKESQAIWIMKAFAILTVIAAHVNQIIDQSFFSLMVTRIWKLLANIGVPAFLIMSGYLAGSSVKWNKKWKSLILPWMICGSVTFLINCLWLRELGRNPEDFFTLQTWGKWVIGYKTWYYYLPVQLILFLLLRWLYPRTVLLFVGGGNTSFCNSGRFWF